MYKIEFNSDMTIEGIFLSFKNLADAGLDSYIEINGTVIYGNDVNLEERIKKEYIKYKENMKISDKNLKTDDNHEFNKQDDLLRKTFERRNDLYFLSQDPTFLFEIGVVLQYTKEEYKEDMLNYYISVYGNNSKNDQGNELNKNLGYMSNLLLILEEDTFLTQMRYRIQQIINYISNNDDEKYKFEIAIKRIELYAIRGKIIRNLLFLNVLNDELSHSNNELNKLLKHPLF